LQFVKSLKTFYPGKIRTHGLLFHWRKRLPLYHAAWAESVNFFLPNTIEEKIFSFNQTSNFLIQEYQMSSSQGVKADPEGVNERFG
jgi:hypothetical protein